MTSMAYPIVFVLILMLTYVQGLPTSSDSETTLSIPRDESGLPTATVPVKVKVGTRTVTSTIEATPETVGVSN